MVCQICIIKMFGWLSRCWGGMGAGSAFQKARVRSIIADWQVPDDHDVCVLIGSFKGSNPQIPAKTALTMFLSHLQMSQQKSNPLFLLKHLYIFDHSVEQGVALQEIAAYYCSEFFIFKQGSNIQFSPLRQLVAAYFLYIKKKAQIYSQLEPRYYEMKKSQREVPISMLAFFQLFALVDKCLSIQKGINQMSAKYKAHNKSSQLIQMIFTMMLKTYIFCYTLVSLCAKTLFSRIKKFNKHEMVQFYKFIRYYNKDYTKNLYDFIQSNKEIYEFKNFKYSQIILIEQSYLQYVENSIEKMDRQPLGMNGPEVLNFDQENGIMALPGELQGQLEYLIVDHPQKRDYRVPPVDHNLQLEFEEYTNLYNQAFESQLESSRRQQFNMRQDRNPNADIQSPLGSSKLLTTSKRIQFQQTIVAHHFDTNIWTNWPSVYSS